jgi:DNA-binding transcriptional ArsR family regulator
MENGTDLARIAGALGERTRASMVIELLGGEALPVAALARAAGVAPSTASGHVARLERAGLVSVRAAGRERLVALAGHDVAEAIEALTLLTGPAQIRSLRAADRLAAERAARSCYDHLAGRLGVGVCDALCAAGALEPGSLALRDPSPLERLGVDVAAARAGRRPLTRACLDWSERRPHLAGGLGAALLGTLLEHEWVARRPGGRALHVTAAGHAALGRVLGIDAAHLGATHGGRAA